VDRLELERTLQHIDDETSAAQNEMLRLQGHLDALVKARDGLRALLEASAPPSAVPDGHEDPVPGTSFPPHLSDKTDTPTESVQQVTRSDETVVVQSPLEKPTGITAASWVLQSDPTRFWPVRSVWEEEQAQHWDHSLDAVRIALVRLHDRGRVERLEKPVMSYRWKSNAS
jgi:hypothetical protein